MNVIRIHMGRRRPMVLHHVSEDDVIDFTYLVTILVEVKLHGYDIGRFPFLRHEPLKTKDMNDLVDWLITGFPNEYAMEL